MMREAWVGGRAPVVVQATTYWVTPSTPRTAVLSTHQRSP